MAGRIPKAFITDLLNRIDIVDVIDNRITLKKTGSNYVACCPFHQEKSPSFTVSPTKQFYHCFGCGSHGSAISFLMEYERMEYVEAIETLAGQIGLVIPYEHTPWTGKTPPKVSSDLYQYLHQAAQFYQSQLPQSSVAKLYLQHRGLSEQIIQKFALGYAPAGWGHLADQFSTEIHPLLETIGLVIKNKQDRYHDRFRDRVMFPIRDQRGRVIGFGGRILNTETTEQPKYLNSPETPIFHKGNVLYGLYEALQAQRDLKQALIVEGYMDVIALAQYGINYAMASMGTAATRQHLERLFRHTSTVIFCFDGDNAGKAAARRALETVLALMEDGRQVRFMFLPETHDPDTLIRTEGVEAFLTRMEKAIGIGEYCFTLLQQQVDMTSLDGRATLTKLAADMIEHIPQGAFRNMMLTDLARRSRMTPNNLEQFVKAPPSNTTVYTKKSLSHGADNRPTSMRLAIALLLQKPHLIQHLPTDWQTLEEHIPGASLLNQIIILLQTQPTLTTATMLEHWRDQPEYAQISKLASLIISIPEAGVEAEFIGAIQQITKMLDEQRIEILLQKASSEGLSVEEKQFLQNLIRKVK